ncbi:nicotinate-nucleotide--dimethylbenzimidazole phosphoribosyltransferase [Kordiimonas laminariae]|uniref:nicotinate-nucleotide--dimethylbenzimidazole phosphoribosyltransferase n=1 Tax=Kordiimonas laminariae TaxID=2917717 RepID=UPI001FF60E09|nr:nicotinate-nucleotide--dimethylbenzimidazole phosphoribosyltransferase [Kordiimonas laminariae]
MTNLKITSHSSFSALLEGLPSPQQHFIDEATQRQSALTKPPGSLGRLEEIAVFLAGWQGKLKPTTDNVHCLVFAGNHGVTRKGVSAFPSEVTEQMVANFATGGAAINQLCAAAGATLDVIALDLDQPVADFTSGPAMSDEECCAAIQAGIDAVPEDADIILLGEMGIGNTTSAAAVAQATFGCFPSDWVGRGTGVDDNGFKAKLKAVEDAHLLHLSSQISSFDILRTVGGRELAAIAGATLAARHKRIPVILDGLISTAAAAALVKSNPDALDHCLISHLSVEPGHKLIAEKVHKKPLLDLGMRLGEASGAAVALMIIKSALAAHNGMATFKEAGVTSGD